MNRAVLVLIAFTCVVSTGFTSRQLDVSLEGEYAVTGFEWYSRLVLKKDNAFEYQYGLGGCQGSIEGKWSQQKDKLILVSDNQAEHNTSDSLRPYYPVFNHTSWQINKGGVRPEKQVDTGCFQTKKLHKKS
jgi:hypothetical protein